MNTLVKLIHNKDGAFYAWQLYRWPIVLSMTQVVPFLAYLSFLHIFPS
jgi:hypothetical protein